MRFLKERQWLIHLAFWLLMYLIYLLQPLFANGEDSVATPSFSYSSAIKAFFHLLGVAATSYFICLVVMKQLLDEKSVAKAMVLLIVGVYSIALIHRFAVIYLAEPLLGYNKKQETILEVLIQFKILFQYYIIGNVVNAFPFVSFYLLLDRQLIKRKQAEVVLEKKEAELLALKSQLNPHFLFNTLNNIYSLAIQYSPKTPQCIEKLAHILDYLLYRCNDKLVPLEKEIDLLKNYLDLQKIRFGDRLELKATYENNHAVTIAPLLLLPIVENIFKHGVEQTINTTDVVICLQCSEKSISFQTENVYDPAAAGRTGIGLQNLQRQLDIIYPGKHSFTITKADRYFKTHLQLSL